MGIDIDADGVDRETDSVGNPKTMHIYHATTMREAQVFCTVLGGIERCAMVQDAWRCCSSIDVKEGALVNMQVELQNQSMFLAQQSGQLGVFLFQVLLEQSGLGRCVACRTFQSP